MITTSRNELRRHPLLTTPTEKLKLGCGAGEGIRFDISAAGMTGRHWFSSMALVPAGFVGLQAAVMEPKFCKGIVLLNISLRMLHIKKQPLLGRPLVKAFQILLRNTPLGKLFFQSVATPHTVRDILCLCYHDMSQVTDELVQIILLPGLQPGADDVFLEFICYSDGPLPEELLPQVKAGVTRIHGNPSSWDEYKEFEPVEDFVILSDVGHCPQDEASFGESTGGDICGTTLFI
ncbi:hypothetical protein Droror1_Dr00023518 [Drosera rotundifolia]